MPWTSVRIRGVSDAASIDRGHRYAAEGRVTVRRAGSDGVFADVDGTEPYAVWLGADRWSCTCPVGVGGSFCKHCVAVAVVIGETAEEPTAAAERATSSTSGRAPVAATGDDARAAVKALGTRRFLDYWRAMDYATEAHGHVDVLERHVRDRGADSVRLVERAFKTVVGVMLRADDSSGLIGDLASRLLELHVEACRLQPPRPRQLVAWLLREQFDSDGFFFPDVVDYAQALGPAGLATYREAITAREPRPQLHGGSDFELERAHQRLAVLDRDVDEIVRTHGDDLSTGHDFAMVVAALDEVDRPDLALDWALRGLQTVGDDPRRSLITYATRRLAADGDHEKALALRRQALQRQPTMARWGELRRDAIEFGRWPGERAAALDMLADRNPADHVSALVVEGDTEAAWAAYDHLTEAPVSLLEHLVKASGAAHPDRVFGAYPVLVEATIMGKNRQAYRQAVGLLRKREQVARRLGRLDDFRSHVRALADEHKAKRALLEELRHARLL